MRPSLRFARDFLPRTAALPVPASRDGVVEYEPALIPGSRGVWDVALPPQSVASTPRGNADGAARPNAGPSVSRTPRRHASSASAWHTSGSNTSSSNTTRFVRDLRRRCEQMSRTQTENRRSLSVPKVFCLGFHKTGTTSVREAMTMLGYSVAGPNGLKDPDIARNVHRLAFRLAERYDAFQDSPWPLLYREMDERYPGSKFVLMLRPSDEWIESQVRHFGERTSPMREWVYGVGCPKGNEAIYVARYEQHNREVLEYFSRRPADLLVLTLSNGDGWEKLCAFLGKEIPNAPFPQSNRAADRENEPRSAPERVVPRARLLAARLTSRLLTGARHQSDAGPPNTPTSS